MDFTSCALHLISECFRISTEVNHLQKANHANIVRIYGLTQWQEFLAIITEYFPNGNLKELLLDKDIDIKPFLQLRMSFDIANGLAFIHNLLPNERLVHGDLKVENVLLTDDLRCKIADFGSSVLSGNTGSMTKTNGVFTNEFTEIYAAPELLANPTMKLRTSHDTYSFGMIIYLILTRRSPVPNNLFNIFLNDIKEGKRPPIDIIELTLKFNKCKIAVESLQLLCSVLMRCWAQNASKRPKMTTVRDELHDQLVEIKSSQVQSQVALALSNMVVAKLSKTKCKCVPINQLQAELSIISQFLGIGIITV